jgi:hypothetical protein
MKKRRTKCGMEAPKVFGLLRPTPKLVKLVGVGFQAGEKTIALCSKQFIDPLVYPV